MTASADLDAVFEEARRLGFLGPRPVADQVAHAAAFGGILESEGAGPAPFLDLGSGGGIPGLVLAGRWPSIGAVLLDGSQRRTAFLRRTVAQLGWSDRVAVLEGRAEVLARDPEHRSAYALVVARSFAPPSVTAEIGGAFVGRDGRLAVSEPVSAADRWPEERLAPLGLGPATVYPGDGAQAAIIPRVGPVPDRWPRAVGIPTKRPLW